MFDTGFWIARFWWDYLEYYKVWEGSTCEIITSLFSGITMFGTSSTKSTCYFCVVVGIYCFCSSIYMWETSTFSPSNTLNSLSDYFELVSSIGLSNDVLVSGDIS